jgi:hypothetical protein
MSGFKETNKVATMKVKKSHGYNINVEEDLKIMEGMWSLSRE